MKLSMFLTVAVLAMGSLVLAATTETRQGAEAKLTIRATDEEGTPLSGMPVHIVFDEEVTREGTTDSNGLYTASGQCSLIDVPIRIVKDGYYESRTFYRFPHWPREKEETWQPWDPVLTMAVRRVVNPIPMYAKEVDTKIPATNTLYGFDLVAADWVRPIGKGLVSDLIFRVDGYWKDYSHNDATMVLTFSDSKDGLVSTDFSMCYARPAGSRFVMPRLAPETGYVSSNTWTKSRRPGVGREKDEVVNDMKEGRGYLLRIRSVTNNAGVVTSAYYGKLRGDFEFGGASAEGSYLKFTYYLNPTPNDRNLEFDPKRNLFKDLKSTEQVAAP